MAEVDTHAKASVFMRESKEKENEELSALEKKLLSWMYAVTKAEDESESKSFKDATVSGELLCNLVNVIEPNIVKKIQKRASTVLWVDNVQYFLTAAEQLGVGKRDLFNSKDIQDNRNRKLIVSCLTAVGMIANSRGVLPALDAKPLSIAPKKAATTTTGAAAAAAATTSTPSTPTTPTTPTATKPAVAKPAAAATSNAATTSAPAATRSLVMKRAKKQRVTPIIKKPAPRERVSEELVWACVKGRSCFLAGKVAGGKRFTREPFNLTNVNSFKHSGIARSNALNVALTYSKNSARYNGVNLEISKKKSINSKAVSVSKKSTFNGKKNVAAVVDAVAGLLTRKALLKPALARYTALARGAPKNRHGKKVKAAAKKA